MSKAKDDVTKMIDSKIKKNNKYKKRVAQRTGPNGIVAQFILAIEKATLNSRSAADFNERLQLEASILNSNMRTLDKDVNLVIEWAKNDGQSWQDLALDGVHIVWSDDYVKNNGVSKELYVDVGTLFLRGDFDE